MEAMRYSKPVSKIFTHLHEMQLGQKTAGNFPVFLKNSTRQKFGYLSASVSTVSEKP